MLKRRVRCCLFHAVSLLVLCAAGSTIPDTTQTTQFSGSAGGSPSAAGSSPAPPASASTAGGRSADSSLQIQLFRHNHTHGLVHFNISDHPTLGQVHHDFHVPHELLHQIQPELHVSMENSTHADFATMDWHTAPPTTQAAPHLNQDGSDDAATIRTESELQSSAPATGSSGTPAVLTPSKAALAEGTGKDTAADAENTADGRTTPDVHVSSDKADTDKNSDAGARDGVPTVQTFKNTTGIENREAEIAEIEKQQRFRVTKFTVIICGVLALTMVALGGIWVHRFRSRYNSRQLLEEDDEEFTVFNIVDRQYAAARMDKYYPLD